MIESIDFYPIGDDEPGLPTAAILDVYVVDQRNADEQARQETYCLGRKAVDQTIKRLERSLAIGSTQHRVYYVGQDEGYKYLVDSTNARRLLNQLRSIIKLM